MQLPQVEVRFRGLDVRATAEPAGRALPSIWNAYRNTLEVHRCSALEASPSPSPSPSRTIRLKCQP